MTLVPETGTEIRNEVVGILGLMFKFDNGERLFVASDGTAELYYFGDFRFKVEAEGKFRFLESGSAELVVKPENARGAESILRNLSPEGHERILDFLQGGNREQSI